MILHSPEGVARFKAALADETPEDLQAARSQLQKFKGQNYFVDGSAGAFTLLQIENELANCARRQRGLFR